MSSKKQLKLHLANVESQLKEFSKNKKENQDEEDKEIIAKENELQKALLELRKQYGLVSQYELYLLELKELNSHLARKLLTEEEYQKSRQAIYNKYLKTPDIQEEEEDFEVPELKPSANSLPKCNRKTAMTSSLSF